MILRRADWQGCLTVYLAKVAHAPFRPGRFDCALFAAGAVQAMTGHDLAAPWRGVYGDLDSGRAALEAGGVTALAGLVAPYFAEIAIDQARAGDLAIIAGRDGHDAFAVVQGSFLYAVGARGLDRVAMSEIKQAFKVG